MGIMEKRNEGEKKKRLSAVSGPVQEVLLLSSLLFRSYTQENVAVLKTTAGVCGGKLSVAGLTCTLFVHPDSNHSDWGFQVNMWCDPIRSDVLHAHNDEWITWFITLQ